MLNPFHETEHTPGGEEGEREPMVGTMLRVPWEGLEIVELVRKRYLPISS